MSPRGFTLIEVMVAMALICVGALAGLQVVALSLRSAAVARTQTLTVALASARLEQLRSLQLAFDGAGNRVTDSATSLSGAVPTTAGAGLTPGGTLDGNVAGFVDYLDAAGRWLGDGTSPPASAAFVRRWTIDATGIDADYLVVQVYVAPLANLAGARGSAAVPGSARLVSMLARTSP